MARVETWVGCDLDKAVQVRQLGGFLFTQDNEGNLLGAKVTQDGEPVNLTGTVVGYAILADGQTVDITGDSTGIQNGNEAYIILPQLAYSVPGQISIVIKLTTADTITTLAAFCGYVYRSKTGQEVVPPGTPIPDLSTLEEAIRNANTAATAANTAAAAAENVDISMSQDGDVITITTTDRQGETKTATLTDQSEAVSGLKSAFEQLDANVITESAGPAPIVSIADGADGMPMRKVEVAIEPVQDLHGYDYPWPAGGGTNLADTREIDVTIAGCHITSDSEGVMSISGTRDDTTGWKVIKTFQTFAPGNYVFSTNSNHVACLVNYTQKGSTFTVTEGDQVKIALYNMTAGEEINDTGIKVIIAKGNTAPEVWTPYANVCPISGWTGAKVTRTGKNLFDPSDFLKCTGWTVENDVYSGSNTQLYGFSLHNGIGVNVFKQNTQYTISFDYKSDNDKNTSFRFVYADGTASSYSNFHGLEYTRVTFSSSAGKTLQRINFGYSAGDKIYLKNVMFEEGSAPTTYVPYAGQTYEVIFPTEAGTVYGGTLDVVAGTLTVTHVCKTVTSCNSIATASTGVKYASIEYSSESPLPEKTSNDSISSEYKYRTNAPSDSGWFRAVPFGTVSAILFIFDSRFVDKETADSILAVEQPQFCYALASPLTPISLDPATITTLLGINNVWSDAGNTAVTYPADTKLYIDKKIAELQALILENNG